MGAFTNLKFHKFFYWIIFFVIFIMMSQIGLSKAGLFQIGDNMIHYADLGGPDRFPVLFIHGLGENLLTWQKLLDRLPQDQCRYLLIDLPGHGQSTAERIGNYSHRHLADQLVEFLNDLSIEKTIVVGHSLGGTLALRMALRYPEKVRALFLISPAVFSIRGLPLSHFIFANPLLRTSIISFANKTLRSPEKLKQTLQDAVYDPSIVNQDLLRRIAQPILENPKSGLSLYYYLRDSSRNHVFPELKNLNCPLFVLNGIEDPWVKISETRRLANLLPNAVLLEIPQCGHMPQEEKPDLVATQLHKFIQMYAK